VIADMVFRTAIGKFAMAAIVVTTLAVAVTSSVVLFSYQTKTPSSSISSSQGSSNSVSTSSTTLVSKTSRSSTSSLQITVVAIKLLAGTATNATAQGTASIEVVLHNPGQATSISSINVLRPPNVKAPMVYQCSSTTTCSLISSPTVDGGSNTGFTSPTTKFFLGVTLSPSLMYGYYINFANGLVALGTINATAVP